MENTEQTDKTKSADPVQEAENQDEKMMNAPPVEQEEVPAIAEEKMNKLEWSDSLSVDIQEIDDLQQKMFALLNVLIDIKNDNANAKDSSTNVAELTEYGRYYFSKEEELLRKAGYPEVEVHAKEHRQFIKTTVSLRRQVAEDKGNLTYDVIRELRDWLIVHISTFDAKYVPFLRTVKYLDDSRKR